MRTVALKVAGTVFLAIALIHVLRVMCAIEVRIANTVVPLWPSGVAAVIALFLGIWMFNETRS